jgi:hypothetical protein
MVCSIRVPSMLLMALWTPLKIQNSRDKGDKLRSREHKVERDLLSRVFVFYAVTMRVCQSFNVEEP